MKSWQALIVAALMSGCAVAHRHRQPDHIEYPVAGAFANRDEVFWGSVDNNLRNGTAFVQAVGENSGTSCTGEGHLTQLGDGPPSCSNAKGACHINCVDGTSVECAYVLTSCTSGYGVGTDANKNWFAFVFGPQITRLARDDVSEKLKAVAASLPTKTTQAATQPSKQESDASLGTGFFVSTDGVLITANHVIEGKKTITALTRQGDSLKAVILNSDPANDIALLKVSAATQPIAVSASTTLAVGDDVLTLGYPLPELEGTEQKATFGRVNALSGLQDDVRFIQIDAPVQPGNSGGPLLNSQGQVVGVIDALLSQDAALKVAGVIPQNVSYATKSDYLLPLLAHDGVPTERKYKKANSTLQRSELVKRIRDSVVLIVAK